MDMSHFHRIRAAPDGAQLDFTTLVAMLDAARDVRDPVPAQCPIDAGEAAPALRHVTVFLGRDGWRQAARSLGGRFAPLARGRAAADAARKPL